MVVIWSNFRPEGMWVRPIIIGPLRRPTPDFTLPLFFLAAWIFFLTHIYAKPSWNISGLGSCFGMS